MKNVKKICSVLILSFLLYSVFLPAQKTKPLKLKPTIVKQKITQDSYRILPRLAFKSKSPYEIQVYVRYHIPKDATQPCTITGYIPNQRDWKPGYPSAVNRENCVLPEFGEGVEGAALIRVKYRNTAPLKTNTIEFVISSRGNSIVRRSFNLVHEWGQRQDAPPVCTIKRVYAILPILTHNSVKMKIEYHLDSTRNYPFSVKAGVAINTIDDNHPGISFVPQSSFSRSGLSRGDKSVIVEVKYNGDEPFECSSIEGYLYSKGKVLCSHKVMWSRIWEQSTVNSCNF